VRIAIGYRSADGRPLPNVAVSVDVRDPYGERLFVIGEAASGEAFAELAPEGQVVCEIPQVLLVEDRYHIDLRVMVSGEWADCVQRAGMLEVVGTDFLGHRKLTKATHGSFVMPHRWRGNPAIAPPNALLRKAEYGEGDTVVPPPTGRRDVAPLGPGVQGLRALPGGLHGASDGGTGEAADGHRA
jgi:hypothetical protein